MRNGGRGRNRRRTMGHGSALRSPQRRRRGRQRCGEEERKEKGQRFREGIAEKGVGKQAAESEGGVEAEEVGERCREDSG